jgi:hypothetical protein
MSRSRSTNSRDASDDRTASAPVPLRGTEELSPALQRWVGAAIESECRRHGRLQPRRGAICAAPTGLALFHDGFPAMNRWAKLFRAYGGRVVPPVKECLLCRRQPLRDFDLALDNRTSLWGQSEGRNKCSPGRKSWVRVDLTI